MLRDMDLEHVTLVNEGSVYTVKGSNRLGFAFYYDLGGIRQPRKVITGSTEEELEAKAFRFLKEKNDSFIMAKETEKMVLEEMKKPVAKTFSEVGAEWYEEYGRRRNARKKPISYSSYQSRGYSLIKLNKYIGDVRVTDITNEMAENLIDSCSVKKDGTYYSKGAVDKDQQVFLTVMEYARKHGYCDQIIDKVVLPDDLTVVDKDSRFLDEHKLKQVLAACKENRRYHTLLKLLLATGLRQEEAFALRMDDFNVTVDGVVEVCINKTVIENESGYEMVNRTKTLRSRRVVYIHENVYNMVRGYYDECISNESANDQYLRSMNGTEGYIFVNKDKEFINKRTFERNFSEYLKRRGITGVTLHMFRHSYASLQAERLSFEKVANQLGDNPKTVYDMYYSVSRKAKKDISDNIGEIYNRFDF